MNDGRSSHLAGLVSTRVEDDTSLSDDAKLLVLAALDGEEELSAALEGEFTPSPTRVTDATDELEAQPVGAFIAKIRARGFRGVGPESTLPLHPASGLTVVAGRNGSGKSSFSEALELALTGDTYRWKRKKNSAWKQNWRNLHDGEPCQIRIELAEEGAGQTTVGVDWEAGAELGQRRTWVQRAGRQREAGTTSLGWGRAVELYQPILSYDELGGLLEDGPSTLFDKLDGILGLDEAVDTERRLSEALRKLQQADKTAKDAQRDLKKELASLDDERAARAHTELRKYRPDVGVVEAITTGASVAPTGDLARLEALTQLRLPERHAVSAAVRDLREAERMLAGRAVDAVETTARRISLLREALDFHQHCGEGPCPVCGEGVLDAFWREGVQQELSAENAALGAFTETRQELDRQRQRAWALLRQVPEPRGAGRFELAALDEARRAWQRWSTQPHDDQLAEHLETAYERLAAAFELLSNEARRVFQENQDRWSPIALRLAEWVGLARAAGEKAELVGHLKTAHEFMKKTVGVLRNDHSAKLTDTAREVWAALKQESNVDLGKIEFTGTGNQRRIKLHAEVDGNEASGGALGVMSQGELHALALALFLPRATMPGSPFRFVVLDDPIQAMDPAKIDGFVDVLLKLAQDRQVVVFTHDDRLPQVLRQIGTDARIVEVERDANSAVHVEPCADPALRYVDDAFAVVNDPNVIVEVKRRVIGGVCRMAVEVACRDIFMASRLGAGERRVDVENVWQSVTSTRQKMALAVAGDKSADLSPWLGAKPGRRRAHRAVTAGVHDGNKGDLTGLVRDVESVVNDIRAGAR
jgi:DNA repair exonuclease SbcCD ATPase subunit